MAGEERERDPSPLVMDAVLKAADAARIGIAVSVLGPHSSRCVYATDTAARMLGTPLEGLVGHSLRDFIDPAHLPRLYALADQMIARPAGAASVVEVMAVRPDGTRFELQLAYAPTTFSGEPAVISYLIDVGSLRRQEQSVRETAMRLAQVVRDAPDAIIVSREAVILEANPAAARMLGVGKPEALVGMSLATFLNAEDSLAMRDRKAMIAQGRNPGPPRVYTFHGADGLQRQVEFASFRLEYQGDPANIAFGRDVTDRERLHQQLERSARLAALGTLSAGVAHEINNPLASVALNAELLERALNDGGRDARLRALGVDALAEVKRSVKRMSDIVRDLTVFTREGAPELGPVQASVVVENALRVASHATRQRAEVRTTIGAVPPLHAHAGKVEQVLVNLLVNAAQAFDPGRPAADCRIHVAVRTREPGWVVIDVADNAAGMSAEVSQRIFDPFFSTKPVGEGTGLGLFVCHNLVKQMGGEITVESHPGRGTTMSVALRAAEGGAAAPRPAEVAVPVARRRVLVIDDEPAMCRTLALLLRDDHEVRTAAGGEEGLAVLAGDWDVEVVLCDLMMPGVSGRDVFERVARERPGFERRIVFMTGGAFTDRARDFVEALPNPRLQKPFTVGQLNEAIEAVCAEPAAPQADGAG